MFVLPLDPLNDSLYKQSTATFYSYIKFYDSLQLYRGQYKDLIEFYYKKYTLKSFKELSIEYQQVKDAEKKHPALYNNAKESLNFKLENERIYNKSCISFEDEYTKAIDWCCEHVDISDKMYLFSYECAKVHLKFNNIELFKKLVWEGIRLSRLMCDTSGVKMGLKMLHESC